MESHFPFNPPKKYILQIDQKCIKQRQLFNIIQVHFKIRTNTFTPVRRRERENIQKGVTIT